MFYSVQAEWKEAEKRRRDVEAQLKKLSALAEDAAERGESIAEEAAEASKSVDDAKRNVEKISRVETIENSKKRNKDDTQQHHQSSLLDPLAARRRLGCSFRRERRKHSSSGEYLQDCFERKTAARTESQII